MTARCDRKAQTHTRLCEVVVTSRRLLAHRRARRQQPQPRAFSTGI